MAELLAAGAAIGVASSLVTFVDVGYEIVKRLNEYADTAKEVPDVLKDVKVQLPVLLRKVEELKQACEHGGDEIDPGSILGDVVSGCEAQVRRLDALVVDILPTPGDSKTKRAARAVASIRYQSEIDRIVAKLETYKSTLMFNFMDMSAALTNLGKRDDTYFMVPILDVSEKIERVHLLKAVTASLQNKKPQDRCQVLVLLGMGGQGKSQLALAYCRQSKLSRTYQGTFWVDATSVNSVTRGFEEIAVRIAKDSGPPETTSEKIAFVLRTISSWEHPWLMVFDNYDQPTTEFNVSKFFPQSPQGSILITSRHEDTAHLGKSIHLTRMTEDESVDLLMCRSKCDVTDANVEEAKRIVSQLGFLPLAIDQAGAFIFSEKLPLKSFLDRYQTERERILNFVPTLSGYRKKIGDGETETALSVFATWELSLQQIVSVDSHPMPHNQSTTDEIEFSKLTLESEPEYDYDLALDFLSICAFLNPSDISEIIFETASQSESCPPWLVNFMTDKVWDHNKYHALLADLAKLSLINMNYQETTISHFSMHPLVTDWLRLRIPQHERYIRAMQSCHLLSCFLVFTDECTIGFEYMQYLLSHTETQLQNVQPYFKNNPLDDLNYYKGYIEGMAIFFHCANRPDVALALFEEFLGACDRIPSATMSHSIRPLFAVSASCSLLGRLNDLESLLAKFSCRLEAVSGSENVELYGVMNKLGDAYFVIDRWTEAEKWYSRSLLGYEKDPDGDMAQITKVYENLGDAYRYQGRMTEAENVLTQALARSERIFGNNDHRTLEVSQSLGELYEDMKRFAEAETLFTRVLSAREQDLGRDHVSTAKTAYFLGRIASRRNDFKEAEAWYQRAFNAQKKALGEEDPLTLNMKFQLACTYANQRRYTEAEEAFLRVLRVLSDKQRLYASDQQAITNVWYWLGIVYHIEGNLPEAERMLKLALGANLKALGAHAESTLLTMSQLGSVYRQQSRFKEAQEMLSPAAEGLTKLLGPNDPTTKEIADELRAVNKKLSPGKTKSILQRISRHI